jgi:hypothetical protein
MEGTNPGSAPSKRRSAPVGHDDFAAVATYRAVTECTTSLTGVVRPLPRVGLVHPRIQAGQPNRAQRSHGLVEGWKVDRGAKFQLGRGAPLATSGSRGHIGWIADENQCTADELGLGGTSERAVRAIPDLCGIDP